MAPAYFTELQPSWESLLYPFIVEFVCICLSFMARAAWQYPAAVAEWEFPSVTKPHHHQPEGDFSHLLIQECCGQLVRKSWPSAASPPSPAWLAASVPSSLDLHPLSSNCHFRFKLRDVSSHTPNDMHGGMDKAVLLREWFSYSAQQWWSRGLCESSSVLITSCYSHQCVSQFDFRLVHSGPGKGSPQSGVDLSFATRTGTRQGIETHLFRTETSRDLSLWTRSIVQGCHNSAELITEITTCE